MESTTVVQLKGVNNEMFNLTTGDKGVYLATDVKGAFYDPPVKAVYEEPGNYPGARYLNHRILRRDITFGVEILNDAASGTNSWLSRDSRWRKAWAYDRDCTLYVTTPQSGTRYLKLRLLESPAVDMFYDPNSNPVNRTVMVCVASDPFWYSDDAVYTATTTTNTTFDPNTFAWPWNQDSLPKEDLVIYVPQCNPTDQYIFPKWTVPGSTFAPAEPYIPGLPWLGAPKSKAVIWTIPDYSWEDVTQVNRRVTMPGLIGGLRTDETQAFNLDGIIEAGTFKIKFNGETTGDIPWDASTGVVKSSLEALASVAYDDVEVTRGETTREEQRIEIENATGGTFTLTFAGQTTAPIPFNTSDTEMEAKLKALTSVNLFDLNVTSKVTNEVQIVTLVGEPTDGTFTLTWDGHTTDPIPWNATAATVELKLGALPGIAASDIKVEKEWFQKYAPWVITFGAGVGSNFKGVAVPLITGSPQGLDGGAGMDVIVTRESRGSRPYLIKFGGTRTGQNVPQIVANPAGLTKNDSKGAAIKVNVVTDLPGGQPYLIRFRNGLSGTAFPIIQIITTGLSGYGTIGYRAWKVGGNGYTAPAENCYIDVDPRAEQVVSESGSTLWARMNGVRFRNPIPPFSGAKNFIVTVSGAVAGQMISLRLPRPWSRPWGLE